MTVTGVRVQDCYPTRRAPEPRVQPRREPVVWGGPQDGPLGAAELAGFDADGYLAVEQLISPEEVRRCRAELERLSADSALREDERVVIEPESAEVRSIFEVHLLSEIFADLVTDPRVVGPARQLLGSEVYVHQSRVNVKPAFSGAGFSWHSDFETWHAEDGMPAMRAVSISISLTHNYVHNGGLMIIPGSHRTFVSCLGETPDDHYKESLRDQQVGTPDQENLRALAADRGIELFTGPAGSATLFDCNCMHASSNNITPFPRSNVFVVFNSVDNACVDPFAASSPRPSFIASRDMRPVAV